MPIGIGIGICEDYADIRKKKLSELQHIVNILVLKCNRNIKSDYQKKIKNQVDSMLLLQMCLGKTSPK